MVPSLYFVSYSLLRVFLYFFFYIISCSFSIIDSTSFIIWCSYISVYSSMYSVHSSFYEVLLHYMRCFWHYICDEHNGTFLHLKCKIQRNSIKLLIALDDTPPHPSAGITWNTLHIKMKQCLICWTIFFSLLYILCPIFS